MARSSLTAARQSRSASRPALGTFHFRATALKGGGAFGGGKKIRWAVGYTDGKNHTVFEVEKSKFRRNGVANGKSGERRRYKLGGQHRLIRN